MLVLLMKNFILYPEPQIQKLFFAMKVEIIHSMLVIDMVLTILIMSGIIKLLIIYLLATLIHTVHVLKDQMI